jgi:uncharacterized protein YecE (DUF72 family)
MDVNAERIFTGCAGWSLGREYSAAFTAEGTHLQRYAARLSCVEINSSFYRPHRLQTYQRWGVCVPADFRFSVKAPKLITHELRLQNCDQALEEFVLQCAGLGDRLGCLLVQLPPSLEFAPANSEAFFVSLRRCFAGHVVLEPRHESWTEAEALLVHYRIAQAAVDPSRISTDSTPRGWPGLKYWRLHGSPRIYYSPYEEQRLERLADEMHTVTADGSCAWCIFDNTASGAALGNALTLAQYLAAKRLW